MANRTFGSPNALPLIQRFPQGLLPLLSIKASDTPETLEQSVSPSLDMMPFYIAERLEVVNAVQAAVTTATFLYTQVPAGEYWYLYNVSAAATTITVGSNVQLVCGISDQAKTNSYLGGMTSPTISVAGQSIVNTGSVPIPTLLKPGMWIFAGTLVAPTQLDLTLRALIARLAVSS